MTSSVPPPSSSAKCDKYGLIDDFDPAGPLPPEAPARSAAAALPAYEGHAALDVQQLRGELEQAIRQRQEALIDKQQLEGERTILRSKLEQASQGGVHERQQLQQLRSQPRGGALTPHALRTPRPLCDSVSVPPPPGTGHPLPPPLATLGQQQSNASPLFRPTPGAASRKRSAGSGSPSKAAPPPSAAAPLLPQQPRAQTPSPAASTSRTPDANQQQQQQQQHP